MAITRTRRRSKTNGRTKTTTTTSKKGISRSYSSKKPSGEFPPPKKIPGATEAPPKNFIWILGSAEKIKY